MADIRIDRKSSNNNYIYIVDDFSDRILIVLDCNHDGGGIYLWRMSNPSYIYDVTTDSHLKIIGTDLV